MVKIIEINTDDTCDELLLNIFECLPLEIKNSLFWSILDLDIVPKQGSLFKYPITDLIKKSYTNKKGYILDWNELNGVIKKIHQVIDILIVGSENKESIEHKPDEKDYFSSYPFVVSVLDANYIEVSTVYPNVINNIEKQFSNTRVLDINSELRGK